MTRTTPSHPADWMAAAFAQPGRTVSDPAYLHTGLAFRMTCRRERTESDRSTDLWHDAVHALYRAHAGGPAVIVH